MKKLLHLYNIGHDPFPHIGKGGLGYHLPQYRKRGRGLHLNKKTGDYDDDRNYSDDQVYDNGFIIGKYDILDDYAQHFKINFEDDAKYMYDNDDKFDGEIEIENPDKIDNPIKYNDDDDEYSKKNEDYEKYKSHQELFDEGLELIEMIQKAQHEKELKKYINGWSSLSTDEKREATNIIFNKYMFDETNKKEIHKIKKLSPEKKSEEFIKWISTQNIKVNESIDNTGKITKEKEFDIPEITHEKLPDEVLESVLSTVLESPSEEYNDTTNTLNNMVQEDDIFASTFSDRLLKPQINKDFKNAFSLLHSVSDLVVEIDGVEYKGTGGLDFEYKIKNNRELFDQIILQTLGPNAEYIGVVPDKTGYEKSDYVIQAKIGDEIYIIDLELKKYMSEQGKKGQDLAAYTKVANFDNIEKINKNTSEHFNNWFYSYKKEIDEAYKYYKDYGDKEEYTNLLSAISTNGKLDKDKLLFQHVLSGEYFPLPLTMTKFQTPSKEVIEETIMKRHGDINLAKKVSKFMHHGLRRNEAERKTIEDFEKNPANKGKKINRILVPLLLVNNGMLTMNIKKVFGNNIPFEVLNMINNIYSKNIKDALGLPACFMSNVNLTETMIKTSLAETPEKIKPSILQELKERRIASLIKKEKVEKEEEERKKAKEEKKKQPKSQLKSVKELEKEKKTKKK